MRVCMYLCVCVFKIFSETTGPTETNFHVEPHWDRRGKFIQGIPVICCSSFKYCQPLGGGGFSRGFYHKCGPAVQGF